MTVSWERKTDGSITLHIDGDLQFDSRDEHIYHECLTLPALAVAKQRTGNSLRVMIAGGADGLSARELLKDSTVASIDLVDIDPQVVSLGQTHFSELNGGAFADPRLHVHVTDAWDFAEKAEAEGRRYDLIISDLTVPADQQGSRMHSIEWYQKLTRLIGPRGVLAANAVSPSATPRAYWSIINSMRSTELHTLPYRVFIPSFKALGYGDDWGFILASAQPITTAELTKVDSYPLPRRTLLNAETIKALCQFPEEFLYFSWQGAPAHSTTDILIHYLINDESLITAGNQWNSLQASWKDLVVPSAQKELCILPPEIRAALAQSSDTIDNEETLFGRVVALVPALRRFQTRKMIADFLKNPHMFLDAIDLWGLVQRLLKRAAELPRKLVRELQMLRERLREWTGDYGALLSCGSRVLTIVAVVVIIGNLMYPDSAYAKGEHGGGGGGHGDHGGGGDRGGGGRGGGGRGDGGRGDRGGRGDGGRGDRGDRGDRGWGNRGGFGNHYDHYGHWGHFGHWGGWHHGWGGWGRPGWGWAGGGWGWGGWSLPAVGFGGFNINVNDNNGQTTDEEGNNYPARQYRNSSVVNNYYNNNGEDNSNDQPPQQSADSGSTSTDESDFRLGPDTDVIKGGRVAVHLTDKAYMVVAPDKSVVLDQDSGNPIMSLATDPVLLWHISSELKRQTLGMQAALQHRQNSGNWANSTQGDADGNGQNDGQDSQNEMQNMQAAIDLLGQAAQNIGTAQQPQGPTQPPIAGAMEVFASTWISPDGKYIIVMRPNGSLNYIDSRSWFADAGKTPMKQRYPDKFKQAVVAYLSNMVKDGDSSTSDMQREKQEAQQRLDALRQRLQSIQANQQPNQNDGMDDDGSDQQQPDERVRRLRTAIRRTNMRLQMVSKQLDNMPQEIATAKQALANLQ